MPPHLALGASIFLPLKDDGRGQPVEPGKVVDCNSLPQITPVRKSVGLGSEFSNLFMQLILITNIHYGFTSLGCRLKESSTLSVPFIQVMCYKHVFFSVPPPFFSWIVDLKRQLVQRKFSQTSCEYPNGLLDFPSPQKNNP